MRDRRFSGHKFRRQHAVAGYILDFYCAGLKLAIEVDGMAHHIDVDRFRRDRRRQNALVALGWTVLRFTWADLTDRPGYVIATIHNAGSVSRLRAK